MGKWRDVTVSASDGLKLNVREYGSAMSELTPVVCLPGLSRTARDFDPLAQHLSGHKHRPRRVLVIESRGRGQSEHDRNWSNYTPSVEAQDALDAMVALAVEPALLVGTSRGGILSMLIAAMRPGVMRGVVLNDIGPEIDMQGLARIKNSLSAGPSRLKDWTDAAVALEKLQGSHFPTFTLDDWRLFARMTYAEGPNGPYRDYDPKLLKTLENIDFSTPMPALWAQFAALRHVPILVLRGELSDILSKDTVQRMKKLHPRCDAMEITGQGHAPMLSDSQILAHISALATSLDDQQA